MRFEFLFIVALVAFALLFSANAFADGENSAGDRSPGDVPSPFDQEPVHFDCWAPGEPGARVLPSCDPSVTPPPQLPVMLGDLLNFSSFEPSPRWWEFWKPGWSTIWE
jgi:hypothetical protein